MNLRGKPPEECRTHNWFGVEGILGENEVFEEGGSGGTSGYEWDKGGGYGGGGTWRDRKWDMPRFEGADPDGWFLGAEKFFSFYRLTERRNGRRSWYLWENKRNLIDCWEWLKEFVLQQFRLTNCGSLHEQWLATTHTTAVLEYRCRFIKMAATLEKILEKILFTGSKRISKYI